VARKLIIAGFVVSFCFIAVYSRHEVLKHPNHNQMEYRIEQIRYANEKPEHGVELQLLKRKEERYAVYRTIDDPRKVELALRLLKQADWQDAKVQMDREPDYKLETIRTEAPFTYAVWLTPRRNLEIVIEGKSKYAKLSDKASRMLTEALDDSSYVRDREGDDHRPRYEPSKRRFEIEG